MRAGIIARVSGILIFKVVPLPRHALDIDGAADFLNVGFDHVHPDAAARNVGDFFGGRQPGQETPGSTSRARSCAPPAQA